MKWIPEPEVIDQLTLGLGWRMPLDSYKTRNNFYCGFEIKGDSDLFPILEGKIELEVPSLTAPEFTLEMAVTPSKISTEHREAVVQLLTDFAKDDDLHAWWDDDRKGPDRKPAKNKQRVLKRLANKIPMYSGEDELDPDKCVITPEEALEYLEFEDVPTENVFKTQLRKMQLKFHPDRNEGEEGPFKKLQKCKSIVEELITG